MASRPHADDQPGDDVESRWQAIVAQLSDLDTDPHEAGDQDLPVADGAEGGDDAGDPDRTAATDGPDTGGDTVALPAPVPDAPPPGPRSWSPDPVAEEADEHFQPPDPGPVLGGDPLLTMAWSVVLTVPVLVVLAVALLGSDVPSLGLRVAGAAFLVGVALLVWRMPHRHQDDDPGTGAVV